MIVSSPETFFQAVHELRQLLGQFSNLGFILLGEDLVGIRCGEPTLAAERLVADLFEHQVPVDLAQRFDLALA